MSVNVGQRNVADTPSNNRCYAVDACLELCLHTLKITANENIFPPLASPVLLSRIQDLAIGIYTTADGANSRDASRESKEWERRLELERATIEGLKEMKSLINVAKRLYHLREKKAGYWSRMRISAYDLTVRWYESELKRYSEIFKLGSLK